MAEEAFHPSERAIKIQGGADYLQVKDRLLWLRKDAPESQVRTELVQLTPEIAVFKASVTRISGGTVTGVGEGHGTETPRGFKDYIEKAETVAIGRALGALGYGTAAAFEEDGAKLADAPVQAQRSPSDASLRPVQKRPMQAGSTQVRAAGTLERTPQAGPGPATEKQIGMLHALASKQNLSADDYHAQIAARFPGKASSKELSKQEASTLIDALQRGDIIETTDEMPEQGDLPEMPDWVQQAPDPWTA